jgi:hypothetical protein
MHVCTVREFCMSLRNFSPLQQSSDSNFTNSPLFDLDLGGFELVDSGGMSAEALLSQEDPVIFHRDMPVHSVHHDTVNI